LRGAGDSNKRREGEEMQRKDVCLPILATHVRPDRGTPSPVSCSPPVRPQQVRGSGCICRSLKKAAVEGEKRVEGGGDEMLI
jgi:hypothetical protein